MSKVFNMVCGGGGPAASIFVTGLSETDTVTATNGTKTLVGKWYSDRNGFLIYPIKDFGTWTVTATDGEQTVTQDILVDVITEYEIEMMYIKLYLYKYGDEREDITGGWTKYYAPNGSSGTAQKNEQTMIVRGASGSSNIECGFITTNYISTVGFKTLKINVVNTISPYNNQCGQVLLSGISDGQDIKITTATGVYSIDLTSYQGDYQVIIWGYIKTAGLEFDKVWLEK